MRVTLLLLVLIGGVCTQYSRPNCEWGRTVIVHLFNWRWTSIAQECEQFLGPKGFCGVQVSPPSEHITKWEHPWWERYQPVSYKLESVSGTRGEFIDMTHRCNAVGVKIYVDVVINHMVGSGQEGNGTGGSYFNSNTLHFPGVPYGPNDFNCCGGNCGEGQATCYSDDCGIDNYNNPDAVRNCRLSGLLDLALGKEYVRNKVAGYYNDLISIGVAGFRVDATKHMWPGDMQAISNKLSSRSLFIFNEVIDMGGEAISGSEYTHLGRITEFRYSASIGGVFRGNTALKYLNNFGMGWGFMRDDDAFVFVDNHDNQRGHGHILTYKDIREYKMANAFMLAWPYGFVRLMSSFDFSDFDQGPPMDGNLVAEIRWNSQGTCDGGWVCEHRWRQIFAMVSFRNYADGQPVRNWWDNGNNQIAFSRGDKGFIAINNEGYWLHKWLQTGLPSGTYCDVISGLKESGQCTGGSVNVGDSGWAEIIVPSDQDPVLAIYEGSKL